ncbi:hypothetical protein D5281_20020 [bacterium 1xD42-62]|uniref:Uncharacterized protein n=1 Tax=Parablautia muri TaxID=2320879 RepID=A0A9X5BIN5_9FIRM|nr:hypothetical protein [Parablautia muri]
MAYNPFIVIDGVGYKTKYEPFQGLPRLLCLEKGLHIDLYLKMIMPHLMSYSLFICMKNIKIIQID